MRPRRRPRPGGPQSHPPQAVSRPLAGPFSYGSCPVHRPMRSRSSRSVAVSRETADYASSFRVNGGKLAGSFRHYRVTARRGCPPPPEASARLRREAGLGPALDLLDPVGGPGAVAGHGALAELVEDGGGVRPHVVVGPQVERAHHGLAIMLAEQRLDVRLEAHRL